MTRAEREKRNDKLIELYQNGLSFQQIGDSVGCSADYARQILTKLGIHKSKPKRSNEELEQLIPVARNLYAEGKTTNEIVAVLHVGTSWLSKVIDTSEKPWKEKRYSEMRAYKAAGHTMAEVAHSFQVSEMTAQRVCKGISPQKSNLKGKPNKCKGVLKSEDRVATFIEGRIPNFEYAGNYTGADGRADIRCKACGAVLNRSMISIRKGHCSCPDCREKELYALKEQRRGLKKKAQEERERKAKERKAEKELKSIAWKNRPYHECAVCGTLTQNPKYCCIACRNRAHNSQHVHKRRAVINAQMVDKDITVEGLYRRDNGVCKICGRRCNWDDYTIKMGNKIAGDWYPSIDHIIPLKHGGLHSWDNVQLAHRRCNYLKGDKIDCE